MLRKRRHSAQANSPEKARLQLRAERRKPLLRILIAMLLLTVGLLLDTESSNAQQPPPRQTIPTRSQGVSRNTVQPAGNPPGNIQSEPENGLPGGLDVDRMLSPGGMSSTLKIMLLLTVLSLAPSIMIMTTCFIRFIIVLGLLRQALGTQNLPPNQIIISLCLFMTFTVMHPIWQQSYDQGIRPYTDPQQGEIQPDLQTAFANTARPIREFMIDQIEMTGNTDAVFMFHSFQHPPKEGEEFQEPETYDEISLSALLPAYMVSELKTAFIIGFQLYLPFVVIDMVISSVLISMGMMMLPPVLISLPFKLLLFIMIDGWYLTVGMLLESVAGYV